MLIVRLVSADVMYKLGAHTVLANDVGAQDEQNFYNFGDTLSGRMRRIRCFLFIESIAFRLVDFIQTLEHLVDPRESS